MVWVTGSDLQHKTVTNTFYSSEVTASWVLVTLNMSYLDNAKKIQEKSKAYKPSLIGQESIASIFNPELSRNYIKSSFGTFLSLAETQKTDLKLFLFLT